MFAGKPRKIRNMDAKRSKRLVLYKRAYRLTLLALGSVQECFKISHLSCVKNPPEQYPPPSSLTREFFLHVFPQKMLLCNQIIPATRSSKVCK